LTHRYLSINDKMMNKIAFSVFYFLVSIHMCFGQVRIAGSVLENDSNNALSNVSVTAARYGQKLIFAYESTNLSGEFLLDIPKEYEIFTLAIKKIGYETIYQDVVIAEQNQENLKLSFYLKKNPLDLQEVVVSTSRAPIVIKSDTVLFDIHHFERKNDQSLEDVLKRIPGFNVLSSGELEYNGRPINKVVIDGQEISNVGAAVTTRSISPHQLAGLELRSKEQSSKIKNSILDETDFMVLDVKLKDEYKNKGFGKVRGTVGYREKVEPGLFGTGFVFKDIVSVHAFVEHDRFGNEEIPLTSVQNIGSEAFAKLFELPTDFNEFRTREGFQSELYGFQDYIQKERSIVGLTSKIKLSDYASLFIGTYNVSGFDHRQRSTNQIFFENFNPSLLEIQNQSKFWLSKNKVELRYDKEHLKIISDVNFVLNNETLNTNAKEKEREKNYFYSSDIRQNEFYFNNKLEYFFVPKKWALSIKSSFAHVNGGKNLLSVHNDSLLRSIQGLSAGETLSNFRQYQDYQDRVYALNAGFYHKRRNGNLTFGLETMYQILIKQKDGLEKKDGLEEMIIVNSPYNLGRRALDYTLLRPYFSSQIRFNKNWTLTNKISYANFNLQDPILYESKRGAFEIDSKLIFNKLPSDFSLSYSRELQMFPLNKIIGGYDLIGFRDVGRPIGILFKPQLGEILELTYSRPFPFGIQMILSTLTGRSFAENGVNIQSIPISETVYDQLETSYLLGEIQFQKTILEESILLEQINSYIGLRQLNSIEGLSPFFVYSNIFLNEFNAHLTPHQSAFTVDLENKLSRFNFSNQLSDSKSKQNMFSTFLNLQLLPSQKQWAIGPYLRTVWFFDGTTGNFTDLGGTFQWKKNTFNLRIIGNNLLNSKTFVRQRAFPAFYELETEGVFGRFFKVALEYSF